MKSSGLWLFVDASIESLARSYPRPANLITTLAKRKGLELVGESTPSYTSHIIVSCPKTRGQRWSKQSPEVEVGSILESEIGCSVGRPAHSIKDTSRPIVPIKDWISQNAQTR